MSHHGKQAKHHVESTQQVASPSMVAAFADQRSSTAVQLKQQEIMHAAQSPNVIQQVTAEEEPIQGEFENEASAQLQESTAAKPNNTGLPDNLKSGVENLSGYSMDDVKVHFNSDKPAQLNAHAYAQGTDIHVAPGQEQHLPHEAWHVVQQKQGRVQATMQMKTGVPVNDDAGLENEADVMGAKALQLKSSDSINISNSDKFNFSASKGVTIQRATAIHCGDQNPNGNTNVWQINHVRAGVHNRAEVLNIDEWAGVPNGAVCNHHVAYNDICNLILDKFSLPSTLQEIAQTIEHIYDNLNFPNAPPGEHANRLNNWIVNPNMTSTWDEANQTINYYIYKICDYAGNLFFWPSKNNANPDYPTNTYLLNGPLNIAWIARYPAKNDVQRLTDETNRIQQGAQDINEAMP